MRLKAQVWSSLAIAAIATAAALPLRATTALQWQAISPSAAGFDAGRLHALRHELASRGTTALLIVRHGKIVCEWYAPGNGPEKLQGTASLAKALVGGLSLLVAMNGGRIAPGDLASKYIPLWKHDPVKSRITIRELATHSSGIEDAEQDNLPHSKLTGWKGAFGGAIPTLSQSPFATLPYYSNRGRASCTAIPEWRRCLML